MVEAARRLIAVIDPRAWREMPARRLFVAGIAVLLLAAAVQPSFGGEAGLSLGWTLLLATATTSIWFVVCLGVIVAYRLIRHRRLRSAAGAAAQLTGFTTLLLGLSSLVTSLFRRALGIP